MFYMLLYKDFKFHLFIYTWRINHSIQLNFRVLPIYTDVIIIEKLSTFPSSVKKKNHRHITRVGFEPMIAFIEQCLTTETTEIAR